MDEEECPVCGVMIDLGERDPCAHYLGFIWDGFISWHYDGEAPKVLRKLQEIWSEIDGHYWQRSYEDEIEKQFMALVKKTAGPSDFKQSLAETFDEEITFEEVLNIVGVDQGDIQTTGGMIGGSGYSYFLNELTKVHEAQKYFEEALAALRKELPEPSEETS